MDALRDPTIIGQLSRAWEDSQADDPKARHEEGGYIVINPDGSLSVERWRRGERFRITPPALDVARCYNGKPVAATFHTHPNPPIDEAGREWQQGPSESDRRWHERRKLRGIVISRALVYEIDANGGVSVSGKRDEVLSS